MNMLELHRKARESIKTNVLHEFKLRYKQNLNIIYGFVEGKEDPCYYRGFIESYLSNGWKLEIWAAGSKDIVYEIYSTFDWKLYNKKRILFFVDRDLSEFIYVKRINDINIYITDNYSIENDIVNRNTCERVLKELCGFSFLSYTDLDKILNNFEKQLDMFQWVLIPIMAHIIFWRRNNIIACLNDIYMKHLFSIRNGKLINNVHPKFGNLKIDYIYNQCQVNSNFRNSNLISNCDINNIIIDFLKKRHYKSFIRGKYLLWFFVEYCNSICRDYNKLDFVSISIQPKTTNNLSQSNGIAQIATRTKMPNSLKLFLDNSLLKYIKICNANNFIKQFLLIKLRVLDFYFLLKNILFD